jgi:hypothetical protein
MELFLYKKTIKIMIIKKKIFFFFLNFNKILFGEEIK